MKQQTIQKKKLQIFWKMDNKAIRLMISGGGTGGHVFPAIAIAKAVQRIAPDSEILFVGAKGKMEMEKVPQAGFRIEGLWISGLQRRLTVKNFSFPFKVVSSLVRSRGLITNFKPDVVVGVGGFASGPLLRVATQMRIPTLIQEQNSFPGITNKILSKRVNKICVAYEGMEKFFPKNKIVITGNPVRNEMVSIDGKQAEAREFFGLNDHQPVILVVGGSLGARTVNEAIKENLKMFADSGFQLIWQTGKGYYETAIQNVRNFAENTYSVFDFISRMDLAYAAADLIISRAGAIAISELCIVGKPVIIVPSPFVAEDHQTKNAMALVQTNAAIMVKDAELMQILGNTVAEVISNKSKQSELSNNIKKLAHENAADAIAEEIYKLIRK